MTVRRPRYKRRLARNGLIDKREVEARLSGIIEEMNTRTTVKRMVVLVEGSRDEDALRRIGYMGPVVRLNSPGIRLTNLSSTLRRLYSGVILLLDYDRHGDMLTNRLRRVLEYEGVEVDTHVREEIYDVCNGGIRRIEELKRFIGITDITVKA